MKIRNVGIYNVYNPLIECKSINGTAQYKLAIFISGHDSSLYIFLCDGYVIDCDPFWFNALNMRRFLCDRIWFMTDSIFIFIKNRRLSIFLYLTDDFVILCSSYSLYIR